MRIGKIPYLNLFPYFYWLENRSQKRYSFVEGVPSEVNRLLRQYQIDISPSSSVEYLRHRDRYLLVPGHSVSSRGPIGSIYLFSHRPLEALDGERVLLTYQSETSVALLKVLISSFYRLRPLFQQSNLPLQEGLKRASAYLVIGDEAILGYRNSQAAYIYDLGDLWYRHTGLPFVFALWIANRQAGPEIDEFKRELDRALQWSMSHIREVAEACYLKGVLTEEELIQYWQGINYSLDEEHMEALRVFELHLRDLDESP